MSKSLRQRESLKVEELMYVKELRLLRTGIPKDTKLKLDDVQIEAIVYRGEFLVNIAGQRTEAFGLHYPVGTYRIDPATLSRPTILNSAFNDLEDAVDLMLNSEVPPTQFPPT